MSKIYKVPVVYQMYGTYEIEAENMGEAVEMVLGDLPLPDNPSYIEDSVDIDYEGIMIHNELDDKELEICKRKEGYE